MTHIVNTQVVQCLGNFNFLSGVEENIRKLLALTRCTLNGLEI